jgi:hypothetical protein
VRASEEHVRTWLEVGWVLVEGLVPTGEIDAATVDLAECFPDPVRYHADPDGERARWLGDPPHPDAGFRWPDDGPGFRPEQHRWHHELPFPGSGALDRLCVHPAVVDFAERALASTDLRLYQAQVTAKYAGEANFEQPMHTDRNHSWVPARSEREWLHVETFLYLSDVDDGAAPTHLVRRGDSTGRSLVAPLFMPDRDPDLFAAEAPAPGVRGSLLAYRPDVFHRAVDMTGDGAARFLLNVSFKHAGQDWVGYHATQSRSTSPGWVRFVERSTPRELELFGFPPPGHAIWDEPLLDATAELYPRLDLTPWRSALAR